MLIFINFIIYFVYVVTAQACLKDKVTTVTIQNYDGPIYVAPCNQNQPCNHCSQLYHISGNNCDCECDCSCASKAPIPYAQCTCMINNPQTPCVATTPQLPCAQTPCGICGAQGTCGQTPCTITTPQLPCAQTSCAICVPQVPCAQTPCAISVPQVPCAPNTCLPIGTLPCTCNAFTSGGSLQGCVSVQGTYLQTCQGSGTPWACYQSCPDQYSGGWPQCYKGNDLSSLPVANCANQFCPCGMKRSGYY